MPPRASHQCNKVQSIHRAAIDAIACCNGALRPPFNAQVAQATATPSAYAMNARHCDMRGMPKTAGNGGRSGVSSPEKNHPSHALSRPGGLGLASSGVSLRGVAAALRPLSETVRTDSTRLRVDLREPRG
jgi:hypothetical protein